MGRKGVIMVFIFIEPLGKSKDSLTPPWAIPLHPSSFRVFSASDLPPVVMPYTTTGSKTCCWPEPCHLPVPPGCLVCSKVLCLRVGALWSKPIHLVLCFPPQHTGVLVRWLMQLWIWGRRLLTPFASYRVGYSSFLLCFIALKCHVSRNKAVVPLHVLNKKPLL